MPVGTGVFTYQKYGIIKDADIICLDYSEDMLLQAEKRFKANSLRHVRTKQGDVGALPFNDGQFDVVLSMNGFHAFPDKERAYSEVNRVLKTGGAFIACYYVKGESRISDWLVNTILSKKGWFTPPFETVGQLRERLKRDYEIQEFHLDGSMVYFKATKKISTQHPRRIRHAVLFPSWHIPSILLKYNEMEFIEKSPARHALGLQRCNHLR